MGIRQFFLLLACSGMMTGVSQTATAHLCTLNGNDARSISQYNQCKADLTVSGMHPKETEQIAAEELSTLKAENKQLRLQLEIIKNRLFEILKDL